MSADMSDYYAYNGGVNIFSRDTETRRLGGMLDKMFQLKADRDAWSNGVQRVAQLDKVFSRNSNRRRNARRVRWASA